MVKRFNGRISDVLKTNRFDSALDLEQTLMRYVVRRSSFVVRRSSFVVRRSSFVVRRSSFSRIDGVHGSHLYNTQLPQSALRSRTPMQAMQDWHKSHPHLFVKSPRNHTGRDTIQRVI